MPKTGKYDVVDIGGGIVGLATARAMARRGSNSVLVLEAEDRLAAHQTGNNSGVIHSGLYYKPGSLKARNCTQGREALYRFCEEQGIAHERCGKIVVATDELELPRLELLEQRGRENGLVGTRNEIWVLSTVGCVAHLAQTIARRANELHKNRCDGVYAFSHPFGCSQVGDDLRHTQGVLAALARNPNAGGVLIVGLGCENNQARSLLEEIPHECRDKVRFFNCQVAKSV